MDVTQAVGITAFSTGTEPTLFCWQGNSRVTVQKKGRLEKDSEFISHTFLLFQYVFYS